MPRTIAVETPGCSGPIRCLTTDELGLVKVIESRGKPGVPKVVETWGAPDASQHVLVASMADHKSNPIMAIARKNGLIELLNPLSGDVVATDKLSEAFPDATQNSSFGALHLFRARRSESRSNTLLMCTDKGKACLRSITVSDKSKESSNAHSVSVWDVCSSGNVLCSSIDGVEKYALFAGKGIEVNMWDLDNCSKIWTAKSPPCNSLGIFTPTWFTALTFLCKDDHRKVVAGTNSHQVRLYDISAQRRPIMSVDFRDAPIRAVAEDGDGYTVYAGTGKGDLASFDMRTGKLLGCFVGKCSGSIRSIARHPERPIIASCGLDRYLRLWDTNTRQLLSAVFLKQILSNVVLDNNFSEEVNPDTCDLVLETSTVANQSEAGDDVDDLGGSRSSEKRTNKGKKAKRKENGTVNQAREIMDTKDNDALKPRGPAIDPEPSRKHKHKKRKKRVPEDDGYES